MTLALATFSTNNAGYMGHPKPVTSQGHTPTCESSPGLVTDPTRDISLGSTNFSSISVVSLNTHPKFSHHVSSSQSDTAACLQDAGATPMPGRSELTVYTCSPRRSFTITYVLLSFPRVPGFRHTWKGFAIPLKGLPALPSKI